MISSKFYLEAITTTAKSQEGPHKTGEFIFLCRLYVYKTHTFILFVHQYNISTKKMDRDYKKM